LSTREEFDEFWQIGVELTGMRQSTKADVPSNPSLTPSMQHLTPVNSLVDDPPVTAQVWWTYAVSSQDTKVDLLIDPQLPPEVMATLVTARQIRSGSALKRIRENLRDHPDASDSEPPPSMQLAEGFGTIIARLTFEEMVTRILPLTSWEEYVAEVKRTRPAERLDAMHAFRDYASQQVDTRWAGWFIHLLAICAVGENGRPGRITYGRRSPALRKAGKLLDALRLPPPGGVPIGRLTLNRQVRASVLRSQRAVKVDAARALFDIRCDDIRWAVVDSGIDARHKWFRGKNLTTGKLWESPFQNDARTANYTRVVEAYDFTKQRQGGRLPAESAEGRGIPKSVLPREVIVHLASGLQMYRPPEHGHGTHVAGILGGANGLCPDIQLLDYRVLDAQGTGDEFTVVAALRHILDTTRAATLSDPTGRRRDLPIHGVNLSISLDADVTSDACGWSLVCRVCDELVRAGVVVVASAGNTGFEDRGGALRSTGQNYRTVSVTDPGNTHRIITVGSTDADRPREYGVSYFSARGPTADGRPKPDLVAPGNRITSAYMYQTADNTPDATATLNGTSMAAAHVSACAALLLARHRELIGKPEEVKRILMASATDLGRDPNFQGAGLVDALRAVQTI